MQISRYARHVRISGGTLTSECYWLIAFRGYSNSPVDIGHFPQRYPVVTVNTGEYFEIL